MEMENVVFESASVCTAWNITTARCKAKSLSKNKSEEPRPSGSGRQAPLPDGHGSESHGSESRTSFCRRRGHCRIHLSPEAGQWNITPTKKTPSPSHAASPEPLCVPVTMRNSVPRCSPTFAIAVADFILRLQQRPGDIA